MTVVLNNNKNNNRLKYRYSSVFHMLPFRVCNQKVLGGQATKL